MKKYWHALLVAALATISGQTIAAGITFDTPPPASVIVVENGLEWIWAAPCAALDPSCGKPGNPPGVYPIQGFDIPTQQQWADSWTDLNELIAAFVVNNAAVCGTPWMNSIFNHCDIGDLQIGGVWHAYANNICNQAFCDNGASETFLVRQGVPEPGSLALLGLGLTVVVALRRRRR